MPLTEPVVIALSALAVLGQLILVGLACLWILSRFWPAARDSLTWLREGLSGMEQWLAFAVALVATSGSLFFSEYSKFIPCHLCWLQRYAMYPLIILIPAAMLIKKRWALIAVLPLPVIGAGIAIYHRYIEIFPEAGSQQCRAGGGCAVNWLQNIAPLAYITVPTLALTAFGLIIAMLLFAIFPVKSEQTSEE